MRPEDLSRRRFLALLAGSVSVLAGPLSAAGQRVRPHPEPRPGVTAEHVLGPDRVPADLAELYSGVRRIPQVVDGIRCYCGCADLEGFYSLLTCYEESGMALHCDVCQDEGALAVRMQAQGRTLDEIRAAIDRRFA
jgi:hypothetical protein